MLKRRLTVCLVLIIIVLGACSSNDAKIEAHKKQREAESQKGFPEKVDKNEDATEAKTEKKDHKKENEPDQDIEEESSQNKEPFKERAGDELQKATDELNEAEVKKLMSYMFDQLYDLARESSESRRDEFFSEQREQVIHDEATKLAEPFSEYMLDDLTYDYAEAFLDIMNCECDAWLPLESSDLNAGFKLIDFTSDTFKAESITLGDALLDGGNKNEWYFEKIDGKWKFADHQIFYEGNGIDDFKLTFEDIESAFYAYDEQKEAYEEDPFPIEFV